MACKQQGLFAPFRWVIRRGKQVHILYLFWQLRPSPVALPEFTTTISLNVGQIFGLIRSRSFRFRYCWSCDVQSLPQVVLNVN